MKQVIMFTTQTCGYCKIAKNFLAQNNIHYIEKDVNKDIQARNEMAKRNISGVPTFLIGDEIVVGFDKEKILKLVDHRLAVCPNCGKKMRVPINKGTIKATCPACNTSFEYKPDK